ncbi:LamG-like jellyroll fold domain-containing protein [Streptomyces sp. NPDC050085]|uniref:LamG-like jellyroll fold domain-containing protein n=1 Tax=Streptomyces sp. NPDC050085 TaxID=3365600 RepID=UPI0037A9A25B
MALPSVAVAAGSQPARTPANAALLPLSPLKESAAFGLDEAAGSRHLLGGKAQEFTAALAGGAQAGAVGKAGSALKLNGSTAYAATAGPVVDTSQSFSVSAWVKLDNKNKNYTFLSQAGSRASGFQLYYSKAYDKWVFNRHAKDADDTAIARSLSTSAAQSGAWTHLTGVYDATAKTVQLFVNGQAQTAASFTTPWKATGGLQIGRVRYQGTYQEYAVGLVDEVRTVQSVMTAADATATAGGELPARLQELASFPLDETAGATRVSGGMGAGPVATLAGGAQAGVAGNAGSALQLNGDSAYAATASSMVDTSQSFSVSAWVKLDNKDRNYTFLSQAGSRASGFQLYYSKAYDKWVFNRHAKDTDDTGIVRSVSTSTAETGVWTQLTGVYDATAKTVQLFVNGQPQKAAAFTTPWKATGGLQIGRVRYQGTFQEYFAGSIDTIRVWKTSVVFGCTDTYAMGHRGAPTLAPENTVASLGMAADHGADWVETDVQFTKDGVPVLMHDDTVDRTTNGTGRVDQLTAAQIAQLTIDGGGRVPTLQQALTSLKPKTARLLLEMKGPQTSAAVDKVLELVANAGMSERTTLQSFDENIVRAAATSPWQTKVALLRSTLDADPVATARSLQLNAYAVQSTSLATRPEVVKQLQQAGVQVYTWTIDSETQWQSMTSWGVDGVITNRSDQFLRWRTTHCTDM